MSERPLLIPGGVNKSGESPFSFPNGSHRGSALQKPPLPLFTRRLASALAVSAAGLALLGSPAKATSLDWTAAGTSTVGGSATWTTNTSGVGSTNWWNGSSAGASLNNNTTSDTAVFAGTAGTVTPGNNISALGAQFTTAGYTFGGSGTLTLGLGGINASTLSSGTTAITNTLFVGSAGVQTWSVGTGSTLALGAIGVGADPADTYTPNGAIVMINKAAGGTITTTALDGWNWRNGAVAGTGLLGPGFVIDNGNNTYDWATGRLRGKASESKKVCEISFPHPF